MTLQELALQVRHVLNLQQQYFRTRSNDALRVSKDAERRLRQTCESILNAGQQGLFDQTEGPEKGVR